MHEWDPHWLRLVTANDIENEDDDENEDDCKIGAPSRTSDADFL